MKVRISDIGPSGLKINETIPLSALNERMAEGEGNDIKFITAPLLNVVINKTIGGAEVRGTITTKYKQPCGLCLDEVERDLVLEANYILQPIVKDEEFSAEENALLDDVGIYFFEGDNVDLEEIVQENIILALARYWTPPKGPKGECSICGKVFAAEIKEEAPVNPLAAALKKAGVKG